MSVSVDTEHRIPKAGDQVRQRVDNHVRLVKVEDGSLLLSPADLAILGRGDARAGAKEVRRMIEIERDRPVSEGHTERPASVRYADANDEAALLDLLMIDVAENAAMVAPPSKEHITAHIQAATQRQGAICGVIETDGAIVAAVLLVPQKWWWSDHWHYSEVPLFVHPAHRRSNHFRDLLKFMEWWTQEMSTQYGYRVYGLCGVLGTRGVREKAIAYRRRYRLAGCAYIYPAPPFVSNGA